MYWNSLVRNKNINKATLLLLHLVVYFSVLSAVLNHLDIPKGPRMSEGWGIKCLINKVTLFNTFLLRLQNRKKWSFRTCRVLNKTSKLKCGKSDLNPSYLKHHEPMLFRRKFYCKSFWTVAFNRESPLKGLENSVDTVDTIANKHNTVISFVSHREEQKGISFCCF